jgi:metacaspase-1
MTKRALCVGINDYPGTQNDLSGCVNDANDWTAALKARGFETDQLLDKSATKAAMLAALGEVVKKAVPGDLVVFQYSGHGSYIFDQDGDEPDGTDEVLCPWDIGQNRPISDDELHDVFAEREKGVKIVMISDSCHSGTVSRFAPPIETGTRTSRVRFLPPENFLPKERITAATRGRAIRHAASPPGRHQSLLVAGCQDAELSYDAWFNGRANGAFTYVALQALKGLPGNATYKQWYKAIRDGLPSAQYPQTPNLYGSATQKHWQVFA